MVETCLRALQLFIVAFGVLQLLTTGLLLMRDPDGSNASWKRKVLIQLLIFTVCYAATAPLTFSVFETACPA